MTLKTTLSIGVIALCALLVTEKVRSETVKPESIVLTKTNTTILENEVNSNTINKVLLDITKSDPIKPYYLFISSPGGSVLDGRRLSYYLQNTDRNIICVASTAISMAFVILQSCPTRVITSDAILMTHQISADMMGSLDLMKTKVDFASKLGDFYDTLMATRMKLGLVEYRSHIHPEWWMVGANDILSNHAADKVVKVTCDKAFEKETNNQPNQPTPTSGNVVSLCPLA